MDPDHSRAAGAPDQARTGNRARAVARCLEFAESSASVGDYADALLWLLVVEATTSGPLPQEWQNESRRWKAERQVRP